MQAYSDPKRESEPYALPDIEVWSEPVMIVYCGRCGEFEMPESVATADSTVWCPSCEREGDTRLLAHPPREAWWYWRCFPGCLPDSGVRGPFETKAEALADAREGVE